MTANDSDVSDGDILTGSQVVRVYGENLTAPFVTLTFGGVEYTPLAQGEDYIEFVIGDNGTATISVDGNRFMSFEVEGIVVPSFLPARLTMSITASNSLPTASRYEAITVVGNCINYDKKVSETNKNLLLYIRDVVATLDENDFSAVNGSILGFGVDGSAQNALLIAPVDANEIVQIRYQDFIIAVANYTTD